MGETNKSSYGESALFLGLGDGDIGTTTRMPKTYSLATVRSGLLMLLFEILICVFIRYMWGYRQIPGMVSYSNSTMTRERSECARHQDNGTPPVTCGWALQRAIFKPWVLHMWLICILELKSIRLHLSCYSLLPQTELKSRKIKGKHIGKTSYCDDVGNISPYREIWNSEGFLYNQKRWETSRKYLFYFKNFILFYRGFYCHAFVIYDFV